MMQKCEDCRKPTKRRRKCNDCGAMICCLCISTSVADLGGPTCYSCDRRYSDPLYVSPAQRRMELQKLRESN